ncbi:DNA polymerase II small subunit [archaeon BMS3Bbin15]|nr:DNA polymerase II small subunit [archaeon BMS3Bbin15]
MNKTEILCRFLDCNINIHPSVLGELRQLCSSELDMSRILDITKRKGTSVVTQELLDEIKNGNEKKTEVIIKGRKKVTAEEYDADIKISRSKDITSKSFTSGNINNFVKFFNHRYEVLGKVLKNRQALTGSNLIEIVKNHSPSESSIIGIVNNKKETKRGHILIELEDPSGISNALILNRDEDLKKISTEIVTDEIIGLKGKYGRGLFIVNEIFFPDVPINREVRKSPDPVVAVLISDVHVGSAKFLDDVFLRFIKWLRMEEGNSSQRELASKVKYIVIGGDIVDGVGIYPEQKEELVIRDIHKQYAKFYEYLSMIPDYIEIIITPGNHDATRQAEPQPAISEDFVQEYYEDPRIHMTGNPLTAELHGVRVVSYHGRSLDDIISAIPGMSYTKPAKAMLSLLKKRHLSPIYGGKVPLAPENTDYLILEELPEILHMGHVHTFDHLTYRNTLVINSGTFQSQTSFQKKVNLQPTPGKIPVVDLQTLKIVKMEFI